VQTGFVFAYFMGSDEIIGNDAGGKVAVWQKFVHH